MGFDFVDEPMRYDEVAEVFSQMHELVCQTVDMFIESATKSLEDCTATVASTEEDMDGLSLFRSASHSMKGSSGLLKAMKLHVACVTLSDVAKYFPNCVERRQDALEQVNVEFARLKQYKTCVLDQMGNSEHSNQDLLSNMPNTSPIDINSLTAEVGGDKAVALESLHQFGNELKAGLDELEALISSGDVDSAIQVSFRLCDTAVPMRAKYAAMVLRGLGDIIGAEREAQEKHLMYVDVLRGECDKIRAFGDYLAGPDAMDLSQLLSQMGGNTTLAKQVVKEFLSSAQGHLSAIYGAMDGGDFAAISNEAKEIQFEASQMFISAFDNVVQRLMQGCASNDGAVVEDGVGALRSLFNELSQATRELQ